MEVVEVGHAHVSHLLVILRVMFLQVLIFLPQFVVQVTDRSIVPRFLQQCVIRDALLAQAAEVVEHEERGVRAWVYALEP